LRNAQKVFLIIENLGILHVIGGVYPSLDIKEVLGIADMGSKIFRHGLQRFEESRKDLGIGLHHGVFGVTDIEANPPVVGVHHCFDRVANVVSHPPGGLRVGVTVRSGVGIDYPEEPAA
jgi:hypothetical protein